MAGSKPIANVGAAITVQAAQGCLASATTTTAVSFDCTAWAGRYVKITVETDAHYYTWASATGATVTPTATALSAASPDATLVDLITADGSTQEVVDPA